LYTWDQLRCNFIYTIHPSNFQNILDIPSLATTTTTSLVDVTKRLFFLEWVAITNGPVSSLAIRHIQTYSKMSFFIAN
jgi:hypothetical protein